MKRGSLTAVSSSGLSPIHEPGGVVDSWDSDESKRHLPLGRTCPKSSQQNPVVYLYFAGAFDISSECFFSLYSVVLCTHERRHIFCHFQIP